LGEPGAGKTTTLMAYARDAVSARLADPAQPLPIMANLFEWPSNDPPPLADWLARIGEQRMELVSPMKSMLVGRYFCWMG
jgi:hypothetical protein